MEIRYAYLENKGIERESFFYFRKPSVPEDVNEDVYQTYVDSEHRDRLAQLKDKIREQSLQRVKEYSCNWTGNGFADLDAFGNMVLEDLWSSVIRNEQYVDRSLWLDAFKDPGLVADLIAGHKPMPEDAVERFAAAYRRELDDQSDPDTKLENEAALMRAFAQRKTQRPAFYGRDQVLQDLRSFVENEVPQGKEPLCVVKAVAGQGKTSLLAAFANELHHQEEYVIIEHYVGSTEESAVLNRLLYRLNRQLSVFDITGMAKPAIPEDTASLKGQLLERLKGYAGERKIVILIDALNQLNDGLELLWLPQLDQANVRFVVSCIDDPKGLPAESRELVVVKAVDVRNPAQITPLDPLLQAEIDEIVKNFLRRYGKALGNKSLNAILSLEQAANPLYLTVMLEELRRQAGPDLNVKVPELIEEMNTRAPDAVGLFNWVLENLEQIEGMSDESVGRWCSYLALGRSGMSGRELSDLLDERLKPDGAQLARRIERHMRLYLMRRSEQLDFFHGQLKLAVENRYITDENVVGLHGDISQYMLQSWQETDSLSFERREHALRELPYHLQHTGEWDDAVTLLSNLQFLDAKQAFIGPLDLVQDVLSTYLSMGDEALGSLQQKLLDTFVDYIALQDENPATPLNMDNLNSWLVYSGNVAYQNVYRKFLDQGAEADQHRLFSLRCQDRLGSYIRRRDVAARKGSGRPLEELMIEVFQEAEDLLEPLPGIFRGEELFKDAGRVDYELAYINYLQNEWPKAVEWFEMGYADSDRGEDPVGAHISRCLSGRLLFLNGELSAEEFESQLNETLALFEKETLGEVPDERAVRWRWNVFASLFTDIAFETRNVQLAEKSLTNMRNDAFGRLFKGDGAYNFYDARMAILLEQWDASISFFRSQLNLGDRPLESLMDSIFDESFARNCLQFGMALQGAGRTEDAALVWQIGLECPDINANLFWKERIRTLI